MDWFTADTHFGSQRTLELSRRPFTSVEEMDAYIAKKWNSVVKATDTVWHLGDFGYLSVVEKYGLNGKINLLFGNYERDEKDQNTLRQNLSKLGITIIPPRTKINLDGTLSCYLCHEPSSMIVTRTKNIFNLFGHVHQLSMVKKEPGDGLNVGTDCHFFTPINISVIKFYREAIWSHYDKEVFL
jgi:calcineurin-like phosphoesterase family protein